MSSQRSAAVSVDLSGRVAIVTGANCGIGLVTARELARAGARLFLACRSRGKGEAAVATLLRELPGARVELLLLDLADLGSVRSAAAAWLARDLPLHLLINNAGLAGAKGLTVDGFELAFGTNHLGHYLLTRLLLERLRASSPSRIVNVSSKGHYLARGIDWQAARAPTRSATGFSEYCVSKLANVLFSQALARRLGDAGVAVSSLHPGSVASDVWRELPAPLRAVVKLFMVSNDQGARTSLHCATAPDCATAPALYYDRCRPKRPSRWAQDEALAEELWRRSAGWVALPG